MKTEGFGVWGSKLRSLFDRYKFVLVVILAGVVLLLLPSFGGEKRDGGAVESSQESGSDPFQVEELERKLEQALAQIDGVGGGAGGADPTERPAPDSGPGLPEHSR